MPENIVVRTFISLKGFLHSNSYTNKLKTGGTMINILITACLSQEFKSQLNFMCNKAEQALKISLVWWWDEKTPTRSPQILLLRNSNWIYKCSLSSLRLFGWFVIFIFLYLLLEQQRFYVTLVPSSGSINNCSREPRQPEENNTQTARICRCSMEKDWKKSM